MPLIMVSKSKMLRVIKDTNLLEVGAGSDNLVDEILDGEDVVLAKCLLDDGVVVEGNALLVDLSVATLVHELTDGLQVRLTERT